MYIVAVCQTLNAKLLDFCTILYVQTDPLDHFVALLYIHRP